MAIRIILADDHAVYRAGVKAMLGSEQDIEVVAETADGRDAVRLAVELRPDVVVMDLRLPDLSGIEAAREIHARKTGATVVFMSALIDPKFFAQAMHAGVSGFVAKENAFEELAPAIRAAAAGKAPAKQAPARRPNG